MGKALREAKRLGFDWETFQAEHPDINLVKDCRGKILRMDIPEYYEISSLLFSKDKTEVIYMTLVDSRYPKNFLHFEK